MTSPFSSQGCFQLIRLRSTSCYRRLLLFFLLLLVGVPSAGQGVDFAALQTPVNIAGTWKFHPGDDPVWAHPQFDDSNWQGLQVPEDWGLQGFKGLSGFAWYRLTLDLCAKNCALEGADADLLHRLAVTLGKVQSAYELYAGGKLVGAMGGMPPNAQIHYDEYGTFRLPRSVIDTDGELVLALRVWRSEQAGQAWEGGPYDGPFILGPVEQLTRYFLHSQLPVLVLSAIYLVLGCYHCYLYTRHRAFAEMLWFGLFAIVVAVYSVMSSQWRFSLALDFAVLKKIELATIFLIAPIAIEFVARLTAIKLWRSVRWYQYSFVLLAVIVIATPGIAMSFKLLPLWQVWALPAILGSMAWIAMQAWLGNTDARKILAGSLVLTAAALFDIFTDLRLAGWPALVPFGFAVFVLSMPLPLGDRITRLVKSLQTRTSELDDLQKKLELSVAQRTEELREANQQLARMAHIDLLTQVANRRAFLTHAENEIAWTKRTGRTFAIIFADIDHFKMFNDQFGHACGDFVLSEVACILNKNVRATDMFARWGGEEFVFILRETSAQGAVELAEKCRLLIEQKRYAYDGMELGVTMTFGVSEFQPWMSVEECIEAADDALFHGKAAGRNTVARSKLGDQQCRPGSFVASPEIA